MNRAEPGGIGEIPSACDDAESRLAALLDRMQQGDRGAAALFMVENGDLIRRRFRGQISRSIRRLFDSQDLVSTLARRLDRIVHRGTLRAESVGEFWSLVMALGKYSLSERARDAKKHRDFRDLEGVTACAGPTTGGRADGGGELALLARCLTRLNDDADATILMLRLGGLSHVHIARHLGLSVESTRKRWERIRKLLRELENEPWAPG